MSSKDWVHHMVKHFWTKEGDNTNIKVFVTHDHDVTDFNSLEYAEDLEMIDCTIFNISIQSADTVVVAFSLAEDILWMTIIGQGLPTNIPNRTVLTSKSLLRKPRYSPMKRGILKRRPMLFMFILLQRMRQSTWPLTVSWIRTGSGYINKLISLKEISSILCLWKYATRSPQYQRDNCRCRNAMSCRNVTMIEPTGLRWRTSSIVIDYSLSQTVNKSRWISASCLWKLNITTGVLSFSVLMIRRTVGWLWCETRVWAKKRKPS